MKLSISSSVKKGNSLLPSSRSNQNECTLLVLTSFIQSPLEEENEKEMLNRAPLSTISFFEIQYKNEIEINLHSLHKIDIEGICKCVSFFLFY